MDEGQECAAAARQAKGLLTPPSVTVPQGGVIVAEPAQIRDSAYRCPLVCFGPGDTFACERRQEKRHPGPARVEREPERPVARSLGVLGDLDTEPFHGPCVIADCGSHQTVADGNRFEQAIGGGHVIEARAAGGAWRAYGPGSVDLLGGDDTADHRELKFDRLVVELLELSLHVLVAT